jgi:hypothetical protein
MLYQDALLLYRDGLTGSGNYTTTAILQNGDIQAFPWYFNDLPDCTLTVEIREYCNKG